MDLQIYLVKPIFQVVVLTDSATTRISVPIVSRSYLPLEGTSLTANEVECLFMLSQKYPPHLFGYTGS